MYFAGSQLATYQSANEALTSASRCYFAVAIPGGTATVAYQSGLSVPPLGSLEILHR